MQRNDVRMLELGRDPDFAEKPLDDGRVVTVQLFQRHDPIEAEVPRAQDPSYAAPRYLFFDVVAVGEYDVLVVPEAG